ncbi:MAG TPA: hypothetical protein VGE18_01495 [Candidatus Paceibacterota bacterium]
MTESTDRTLLALFLIIAILAVIVYFSPRVATRGVVTNRWYTTTAPASAGTVVRGISPVSSSRSQSYYSSDSSSSYTTTSTPQNTTTTTYYNY